MTGSMTLVRPGRLLAAIVTVVSLPITLKQTWFTTSGMTGLTLAGMIEDPACLSGSRISPRPARGPEDSRRRSLQILESLDGQALERGVHGHVGAGVARGLQQVGGAHGFHGRHKGKGGAHYHGQASTNLESPNFNGVHLQHGHKACHEHGALNHHYPVLVAKPTHNTCQDKNGGKVACEHGKHVLQANGQATRKLGRPSSW